MLQCELPSTSMKLSQMNTKWYFDKLKQLNQNHSNKSPHQQENNSSLKKNILQSNHSTFQQQQQQQQHRSSSKPSIKSIPLPTTEQKCENNHSSRSVKSSSTRTPMIPPTSLFSTELLSNSSHSLTTTTTTNLPKDDQDYLSERRNSSTTFLSDKSHCLNSNPRCHRISSSTTNSIARETCSILGPQLCSDCIQIETRTNLSPQYLSHSDIHQRLTALAIRKYLRNNHKLSNEQLIELIDQNQIQLNNQFRSTKIDSLIQTDDQYFDYLSLLLNQQYAGQSSPYYFRNLNDFARKYQSNKYQRLLLSETPPPTSSNPLFNDGLLERLDISTKYSYQKRASTIKPNVKSSITNSISSKTTNPFYCKYRSLRNSSSSLLHQTIQPNSNRFQKTLIGSKYSHQQIVHL